MADPTITESIQRYLTRLRDEGIPVAFGVLYGSHAKGTARGDSDIDLVVVSPLFNDQAPWTDVRRLWRAAARVDSRIEPIPCGERQWREGSDSMIVEIARREGQTVELN